MMKCHYVILNTNNIDVPYYSFIAMMKNTSYHIILIILTNIININMHASNITISYIH